ncbi:MAG: transcriptional repressor [Planctomycetes bacterium]|nr:transcriptional repressor [Planctomycetota bacterium]
MRVKKQPIDVKAMFNLFLGKKGLRQTKQRNKVVDVFLRMERHLSTQELFDIVRKKDKDISYTTVAMTLKLLVESGLCRSVDFGDGIQRYEHKYGHEHHDHLICIKCGKFVEVYSKKLEKLQEELVKTLGYIQVYHKLDMFGLCSKCRKKNRRGKQKA